jgi:hypothetical protein
LISICPGLPTVFIISRGNDCGDCEVPLQAFISIL